MSKITLNIVEPGGSTPVGPSVPNTGLFVHGIGTPEAIIIASGVLILAVVGIIITAYLHGKYKKTGKFTRLIHAKRARTAKSDKKRLATGFATISLLVLGCAFTAFLLKASATNSDGNLTVNVSDEEFTIEVTDEPVFAVLPVEISVEEATQAGYKLTAYTENTNFVSTTDSSNVIPMVILEGDDLATLADNTWGLTLEGEPSSKDDAVYTTLSTDEDNPTILKASTDYTPTEANDTTTIYYGFYITPDIPRGTYTGSDIHYDATVSAVPVTFDGRGLYFNDDSSQTTNEVEYAIVPKEGEGYALGQAVSGEYKVPGQALPYNFLGWSTEPWAYSPSYTSEQAIIDYLSITPDTPITLYAVWQRATTITFDSNGGTGEMENQTIIAEEYAKLRKNTFEKEGHIFVGWNIVATPTEEEPGELYLDEIYYRAGIGSNNVTLYAQWQETLYMQDVATWGSGLEIGDERIAIDNRDNKRYYVAKLKDGNIWMTQNLDHDIVSTPNFYTYDNTDIGHGNTPNPDATWTGTATLATGTTTWESSYTAPGSYDPGDRYWKGDVKSGSFDSNTLDYGNPHYHVGNYYNWTAAVAMNSSSSYSSQRDTNQSICPAGWRLPINSGDKSYADLITKQGMTSGSNGNVHRSPTYFVYAGMWGGEFVGFGYYGRYWSSAAKSTNYSYMLNFTADGIIRNDYSYRSEARPLRCVAR